MEVNQEQEKRNAHRECRRGDYEIVKDILQFISSKYDCKTAEITSGASLTYFQQKRYLGLLTDNGLILISSESDYCEGYEISDSGRRYLQVFAEIEDDLRPTSH